MTNPIKFYAITGGTNDNPTHTLYKWDGHNHAEVWTGTDWAPAFIGVVTTLAGKFNGYLPKSMKPAAREITETELEHLKPTAKVPSPEDLQKAADSSEPFNQWLTETHPTVADTYPPTYFGWTDWKENQERQESRDSGPHYWQDW